MYPVVKRLIDIIISVVVLLILLPLFIPIVILLRLTGEGEIFYFQKRIGLNNEYFYICKFATMLKDSPNLGTGSITLKNDPRLMPMGPFLRKTKINELPQIWNVLNGDMSIVGPRPLVDRTFNAYPSDIRDQIYKVKPGITGIGSIIFRDEETLISNSGEEPHAFYERVVAPYKGQLEMWYQKNASIITDVLIIFLTAWVILFPSSNLAHALFKDLPKKNF